MNLSIIIPAFNEENIIEDTIRWIKELSNKNRIREIIVVDGGSSDKTRQVARKAGATVVSSPRKGRATQMNYGAGLATGEMLYFLHADTIPPYRFDKKIINDAERGNPAGCFQLSFDYDHVLLKFYAWFTHFNINAFRFGDQSLFIEKLLFQTIGGFRENHMVMEDNEMVVRIKKEAPFVILDDSVITSARKYRENGIIKLQLVFILIFFLYHIGYSQEGLVAVYQRFIHI